MYMLIILKKIYTEISIELYKNENIKFFIFS